MKFESRSAWRVFFLLCLVAASACGKKPPTDTPPVREITQLQLPETLLGTWSPYSKSIEEFGNLTVSTAALSWGTCTETKYRVLQVTEQTYYLELITPPCRLHLPASFLILAPSDGSLEVSICSGREELDRSAGQRSCSMGILHKLND